MRICVMSNGAFAHVGPYLEYFKDAGHDVHFLALSPSPPRPVPTHDLGLGGAYSGTAGKWKYPLSMLRARALVRRLKPDIVHTHYATSGGLAGLVCGFQPTIVTAHGTDLATGVDSALWRFLLKAVFAQAACVNTVSEELKAMALGLGIDASKVEVLTLGVDTRRFFPGEPRAFEAARGFRLICTRRLEPVYDPRTILEALAVLKENGVPFRMTFAGDGSARPAMEALAARLGLACDVTFLGEVAHEMLPAVLREHDVYLSASRRDGTSLSLLEAMASGLFPIVSDIPANAAWLEDGEGGFLHPAGDPQGLGRKIMELARRPEWAGPAARRNRAVVAALGDRTTNMRRLERLYQELVSRAADSRAIKKSCRASI